MAVRLVSKMNRSCFAVVWKSRDVESKLHRHPDFYLFVVVVMFYSSFCATYSNIVIVLIIN